MNQGAHPEELPAEVLDDVASVVGAEVTVLSRLPGGVNGGAMLVQLAGRAHAVLKAVPRAHPNHGLDFNETPEQSLLRQSVARLSGYSSVVSALVERLRLVCADVPPPREAPDMVHADLSTPSNVLVRNGAVVAVVDIGNAGSGTRATDLTTLVWYTFQDPLLDGVRRRLSTRILDLVGWEGAAVLTATQILLQLELAIRLGRHDVVAGVVKRGHRALDELNALR